MTESTKRAKALPEGGVNASAQKQFVAESAALLADDFNLDDFLGQSSGSSLVGRPSAKAKAVAKGALSGGASVPALPGHWESQRQSRSRSLFQFAGYEASYKVVEKSCKGAKDPVVAARNLRKNTLKQFNQVTAKVEAAIKDCRAALETLHDDFDSEDRTSASNTQT